MPSASDYVQPEYPNNKVIRSRLGHVIEIDDTDSADRISIYHRSGATVEMLTDGRVMITSPAKLYIASATDIRISAEQDIQIAAGRDLGITVGRNTNIETTGTSNIASTGNLDMTAPNYTLTGAGALSRPHNGRRPQARDRPLDPLPQARAVRAAGRQGRGLSRPPRAAGARPAAPSAIRWETTAGEDDRPCCTR